jgi:small neutral amino acid transporter SnatA (MarC family)
MDHDLRCALLLGLDPLGSLPGAISTTRNAAPERRTRVVLRERTQAFVALLVFMLTGQAFLTQVRLSERSPEVAGGVILPIFATGGELHASDGKGRESSILPLAVPLPAGPSAMATALLSLRQPKRYFVG